jgi:hypothetical protein
MKLNKKEIAKLKEELVDTSYKIGVNEISIDPDIYSGCYIRTWDKYSHVFNKIDENKRLTRDGNGSFCVRHVLCSPKDFQNIKAKFFDSKNPLLVSWDARYSVKIRDAQRKTEHIVTVKSALSDYREVLVEAFKKYVLDTIAPIEISYKSTPRSFKDKCAALLAADNYHIAARDIWFDHDLTFYDAETNKIIGEFERF